MHMSDVLVGKSEDPRDEECLAGSCPKITFIVPRRAVSTPGISPDAICRVAEANLEVGVVSQSPKVMSHI